MKEYMEEMLHILKMRAAQLESNDSKSIELDLVKNRIEELELKWNFGEDVGIENTI